MSLFQCERCGCAENTALSDQGVKGFTEEWYCWDGIEDRKGKLLCSACGPPKHDDGSPSGLGEWHGEFERIFLPIGRFKTNNEGNLVHTRTGSTDYHKYNLAKYVDQETINRGLRDINND